MRIIILTVGSRGDVQPYLALGIALKRAGHQVTLASHKSFQDWVESFGLRFWPTAGNPIEAIHDEAGRNWLESSHNPLIFVRRMIAVAQPMMEAILASWEEACQSTDLIVYPVLASFGAQSLGEKYGIPVCAAYLQHVHRTRLYPWSLAQPNVSIGPLNVAGPLYNRATHLVAEQIFWQVIRPIVNKWRCEQLKLPRYPFSSQFSTWVRKRSLCLYGISPTVLSKAPEWGSEVHMTGYWFLDGSKEWKPQSAMIDFLANGAPPIYVGFGSMSNRDPEAVTEIVLTALEQTGQRGVLLSGWGGLQNQALPDHIMAIDSAPHDWLFPQMAAVVHHGGAGTTAAGLLAGVPSIITPFFADQPFWAWRVNQLGCGPTPIPRKKLSVERLAAAIDQAISNSEMRMAAQRIGEKIQAEDGVGNAVKLIEAYFG